jgi:hypothetical protein
MKLTLEIVQKLTDIAGPDILINYLYGSGLTELAAFPPHLKRWLISEPSTARTLDEVFLPNGPVISVSRIPKNL